MRLGFAATPGRSLEKEQHHPMTRSIPSPSSSPTTTQRGNPAQPIYGGNTTPRRISMTNGHQLASARRRPDGTILVHTLQAPLRRLRFAVYHRPLLRGLALLPTQIGDTIALLRLEHTTSQHPDPGQGPPQPATAPNGQLDAQVLAVTAALVAIGWPLAGMAGTQLTLSGAAAIGGHLRWLPSILAGIGFAVRPILRWRLAQRTPGGDELAVLHGAEHQAINCVRHGWALTDDNIAASPVESSNCDSALKLADQLVFVPIAAVVEVWLPGWPLWVQLAAGLGVYLLARPLAFELNTLQATRRPAARRHRALGLLRRLGLRRQTKTTTRPGGAEHREVAARALAPLLPPEQQARVGAFPSPVRVVSVPATVEETTW
jgi:uncharacterized protein YqhQ